MTMEHILQKKINNTDRHRKYLLMNIFISAYMYAYVWVFLHYKHTHILSEKLESNEWDENSIYK